MLFTGKNVVIDDVILFVSGLIVIEYHITPQQFGIFKVSDTMSVKLVNKPINYIGAKLSKLNAKTVLGTIQSL